MGNKHCLTNLMPYEAYEGLNSEKLENCRESTGPDMDMTDTEQILGCRH